MAFMFSSNDPQATFECAIDGEAFSSCESPAQYSSLALGDHIFRVRAVDLALNVDPTPASYLFTVAAMPETFIDSGPEAELNGSVANFTFSSDQTDATFECSLDLGPYAACSANHQITALADGEHTLMVRAKSARGIVDSTPEEWSWNVSGSAPDTTIVSGPPASTTSQTATFVFSASEGEVEYQCSLDGAPFEQCDAPNDLVHHLIEAVPLGQHTLRVRAVDADGFFDPTPASHTWTVVAPPQTTIDSGPADPTESTSATIAFSSDRLGATFECALDGGPFVGCTSPVQYADLAVGVHSFAVRATDAAGHVDPTPAGHAWTVTRPRETTPPVTTIDSGPANPTASTTARFHFSASELGVTFDCSLDGAAFDTCVPGITYHDLAIGEHTFRVQATDAAGNEEETPVSYTWTIREGDATPPETMITEAPPATSTSISATFSFWASEPARRSSARSTAPRSRPARATVTYNDLPAGENIFHVRARDAAGNVDPVPAIYEWIVEDDTPPDTRDRRRSPTTRAARTTSSSSSPGPTTTRSSTARSRSSSSSAASTTRASPRGTTASSPQTYNSLSAGSHTFEVRAIDESGNVDPTPASYTWTVDITLDTTPPQTTIGSGPSATTTETSATFAFSSPDTGATFECSLDGAPYEACVTGVQYTDLAVGEHTFSVRAKDAAGNPDPTPATHVWTVQAPPDTTAPQTTIDSGPADSESTSATVTFSANEASTFECALDGQSFSSCSSPAQLTGLAVGVHNFQVRAKDTVGQRRPDAGQPYVARPAAAEHHDRHRAGSRDREHRRNVHVLVRPERRRLRVRARRRGLRALHLRRGVHRAGARLP